MKTRDIVCDSGSLITLTSSCLDRLLYFFAEKHNVRFMIPKAVEHETVGRVLDENIRKHIYSALRIRQAIDDGIIARVDADVSLQGSRLMNAANNLFYVKGKPLRLIQEGEAQMLALSRSVGVDYLLMDERTTRMLIEAPIRLKTHLEQEFGVNAMVNKENLRRLSSELSGLRTLRSSELAMLAFEKGYFDDMESRKIDMLEAALYKMKYSGCSISFDEIKSYMESVPRIVA